MTSSHRFIGVAVTVSIRIGRWCCLKRGVVCEKLALKAIIETVEIVIRRGTVHFEISIGVSNVTASPHNETSQPGRGVRRDGHCGLQKIQTSVETILVKNHRPQRDAITSDREGAVCGDVRARDTGVKRFSWIRRERVSRWRDRK